jgi:hypothetical protein
MHVDKRFNGLPIRHGTISNKTTRRMDLLDRLCSRTDLLW